MAFHVCRVGTKVIHSLSKYLLPIELFCAAQATHAPSARLMPCEKRPVVSVFTLGRNTSLCQTEEATAAHSHPITLFIVMLNPATVTCIAETPTASGLKSAHLLCQSPKQVILTVTSSSPQVQTVALFLCTVLSSSSPLAHLHLWPMQKEEGQEVLKGQAHCHTSTPPFPLVRTQLIQPPGLGRH